MASIGCGRSNVRVPTPCARIQPLQFTRFFVRKAFLPFLCQDQLGPNQDVRLPR